MLLKLAWRNIWRNKRRTYITAASIMFAVLAAVSMKSIQRGAWGHMVDNVVQSFFGFAQIHKTDYWEEQSLDKAFPYDQAMAQLPDDISTINKFVPRLQSFALASHEDASLGVLLVGTDPQAEDQLTDLKGRLSKGAYLDGNDKAVLIAEGIGEKLKLGVGDTIVMISMGYRGVNAAGKYPIKGMVHFGSPQLNKRMIYAPLALTQDFFGAEGLVTSVAIDIEDKRDVDFAIAALESKLSGENLEEYEIKNWEEMIPELVEAKQLDEAGATVVLAILYIIIAFGIFGTILMMTKEREYEFGVLLSIGMNRFLLGATIWIETVMLGIIGAIAGIIISTPLVYYFYKNPITFTGDMAAAYEKFGVEAILPAAFEFDIFIVQAIVVLIMTSLLALYPIFKIRKLHPVKAMRG